MEKLRNRRAWAYLGLIATLTLFVANCGVLFWHTVYSLSDPQGTAKVIVQEKCKLSDCRVRVLATSAKGTVNIANAEGCIIAFVHAIWVGSVVGAFVDGSSLCWSRQIRVAYDVAKQKPVPFETIATPLKASIINNYSVTEQELEANHGDVLEWATAKNDGRPQRSTTEFIQRAKRLGQEP